MKMKWAESMLEIPVVSKKRCLYWCILGSTMFFSGLFFLLFNPVSRIVKWQTSMREGTFAASLWQDLPVELINYVYVFNITNSERFLSGEDEKLSLQEVGPFVYREVRKNKNMTFNDNGTLTYVPDVTIYFMPERSAGNISTDVITTFNVPLMGLMSLYSDASSFTKFALNLLVSSTDSKTFVTMTVEDFLWGYEDPLIKLSSSYMPSWIDFDKFGILDRLFASRPELVTVNINESAGGTYEIQTWDGSPGLMKWHYDDPYRLPCNTLRGAFEGLILPPNYPAGRSIEVYRKMFCKKLHLNFNHTGVDPSGLETHHYSVDMQDFSCSNPDNICFCPKNQPHLPEGFIDIAPCFYNLPFTISFPHFLYSEPELGDQYIGLKPEAEKHSTYYTSLVDIGVPIDLSIKVQANMVIKNVKFNKETRPLSDSILPLIWLDVRVEGLPSYLMLLLVWAFKYLPIIQTFLGWSLSIFGLPLFIYYLTVYYNLPKATAERQGRRYSLLYLQKIQLKDLPIKSEVIEPMLKQYDF